MKRIIIVSSLFWSCALFCSETDEKYMILSEQQMFQDLVKLGLKYDKEGQIRLQYPKIARSENGLLFPINSLASIALQNDGKMRYFHLFEDSTRKRVTIILDPDITKVFVICAKTVKCSPKKVELYIGQDEEGGEYYDPVNPLPNVYGSIPLLRVENGVIKKVYEGNAVLIDETSE